MEEIIDLLKEKISDSDMVLIGIGEEFDIDKKNTFANENNFSEVLDEEENQWLCPFFYAKEAYKEPVIDAYCNLYEMIKDKNYFIVSMRTDDIVYDDKIGFSKERIVAPCGGTHLLQCENNCQDKVYTLEGEMETEMEKVWSSVLKKDKEIHIKGKMCPACGSRLVFNNINVEKYCESGYLPMWEKYTKWMQGTLNRKLCIIELGVGMKYPSVIRWPFEKTAFLNQKACLFRVHSKLFYLTEELKGKGYSIAKKPVEFLLEASRN